MADKNGSSAANLGFEDKLWKAADALRSNMDAAENKHVVLGLIFLKYISDVFEERHALLEAEIAQGADPEDPDEYRRRHRPDRRHLPRLARGCAGQRPRVDAGALRVGAEAQEEGGEPFAEVVTRLVETLRAQQAEAARLDAAIAANLEGLGYGLPE